MRDEADVLVLAGDLTNFGQPDEMEPLLNVLVRLRLPTIVVLGNHDYESGKEAELCSADHLCGNQATRWQRLRERWSWLCRH